VSIIDVARAWHDQDPDDETRTELALLLTDAEAGSEVAIAQLHDRFDTRL
jgi:phosphomannomutase